MKYRQDSRTKDEFAKDIKKCSEIEKTLISAYVSDIISKTGQKYTWRASNSLADGNLVENNKHVTTEADFIIIQPDGCENGVEIKFSRKNSDVFRLKISQIKSYIKQGCDVVTFMGIDSNTPKYNILKTSDLQTLLETLPTEYFHPWKKDVKRILSKDCLWYTIDKI